jgi:drug/metabolite transporter (DMT)-like permease
MANQGPANTLRHLTLAATMLYIAIVIFSWGVNYPLMKLAIRDMPPLTFAALRLLGGALVVWAIMRLTRAKRVLPPNTELLGLAGVGVLQFSSVLGLTGIALMVLPAGRTITAVYSMPLWAAIFDWLFFRTRLAPMQICGITVSLGGLLLFLDPSVLDWRADGVAAGMVMTLLAAMLWALGAVFYRTRVWTAPLLSQTLWQLVTSGLVVACAALLLEAPLSTTPSVTLGIILVWSWLIPMALAVWAWTKVLSRLSASTAGQLLMSTPFVGIAASSVIFNESLPPAFAVSALFIAVGGLMVLIKRNSPQTIVTPQNLDK